MGDETGARAEVGGQQRRQRWPQPKTANMFWTS